MNPIVGDISVLMSVYKNDNPYYLDIALKSVYEDQTLKPKQIVVVADGKITAELTAVINKFENKCYEPNLFVFIQLEKNSGLATALNEGLKKCRYDIIARMDADDISLPKRFEYQYNFMLSNSDISVCGTIIEEIDQDTGEYISSRFVPLNHNEIKKFARKRSPVSHPSVMFRKNKIVALGGYPQFRKSQDYALWSLLLVNDVKFANIDKVLLQMRTGKDFVARRGINHLKYELKVLIFQYQIGFLSKFDFIISFILRSFFRIMPYSAKKILYFLVRKIKA